MVTRATLLAGAVIGGVVASGTAQQQLFHVDAPPLGPLGGPFGDHLAIIGDKNGDGHDDVVTSGYIELYPGATLRPMPWFLDGRTGQTLGHGPWNWINGMASAGDVDGDDIADYAVSGAGRWGAACAPFQCAGVVVRSGRDDHVIYTADMYPYPDMGRMILGDVDLDGDGRADLLSGTSTWVPFAGVGAGILYAF